MSERGYTTSGKTIGVVAFIVALCLCGVIGILTVGTSPWPVIWDKEALVDACGDWLDACAAAKARGEKLPPMPPEIARLDRGYTNFGGTWATDDQVMIFVDQRDDDGFFGRFSLDWISRFTCYFYLVYPLERDNPDYTPQPSGMEYKATSHPRIFKAWRKHEWEL